MQLFDLLKFISQTQTSQRQNTTAERKDSSSLARVTWVEKEAQTLIATVFQTTIVQMSANIVTSYAASLHVLLHALLSLLGVHASSFQHNPSAHSLR